MRKISKGLTLTIIIMIILSLSLTAMASTDIETDFNEYGFKNQKLQNTIQESISGISGSASAWESFASQVGVPLDKKWTVTFSHKFEYSSIAAVSIVKGDEFIPVTISRGANDKLVVFPKDKFSGNTNYSLRIVLDNGKKYKKDFTTTNENRNADIEANNSFNEASAINTNEKVLGKITVNDKDYYRVEIPKEGTLKVDLLSLEQKGLDLYLYGEEHDKGSMQYFRNNSKGSVTEGVRPGVYYIYVTGYNSSTESEYQLEVSYIPSEYKDDNAGSTFVNAEKTHLNEKVTGHIGYKSANGRGNYNDYYKVEVPKEGTLKVDLTSLEQKGLDLYLYGEDYDQGSMEYFRNKYKGGLIEGVGPGVYYIYVTGYYDNTYSPYELEVSYDPSEYENDNAGNMFVNAKKTNLNEKFTGHIGYERANNRGNYNDYYKVEVIKDGNLTIDLSSLHQKGLDLYLYPEDYDKGSMKYFRNKYKGSVSQDVSPGIYYIYVTAYNDSTYSPYELSVIFN